MRWLLESAVQGHQQQPSQTVSAAPPASSVATGLAGGLVAAQSRSGDSFDTNMVIILAALLCALILALGLNSILRCALRCSTSPQAPAGSKVPRGGLKKGALRKLPLTTYVSAGATEAASSATECPICLGDFVDGDQIRPLPGCGHGFHVKCVDTWLVSNSSCPTCRRSLLADGGLKAKEARVAPAAAEQEPRMGYRVGGYLLPSFVIAPPPPLA